mgnify:CR=1 FL=1
MRHPRCAAPGCKNRVLPKKYSQPRKYCSSKCSSAVAKQQAREWYWKKKAVQV